MPRRDAGPAVADLTFDVRPGEVTGLLGRPGAGKTTALRLLLGMEAGRGATLVDGHPLHELPEPARQIGAVIGDVPGHPARTARGHLRMLCHAFGVPVPRADELLHLTGLDAVADERLNTYSLAMDRRLGIAAALLADPRVLVLDDPVRELPPREAAWVHDLVRRHAAAGGAVLLAGRDARALARTADRVIVLDGGRVVADEPAEQFARTRMRRYVAVRSPYAQRLGDLLAYEGAEVVAAGSTRLSVFGTTCAAVGETAYRHGILLHQLADQEPDDAETDSPQPPAEGAPSRLRRLAAVLRTPRRTPRRDGPVRALGYEVRRAFGVRTPWLVACAALLASAIGTALTARSGAAATAAPLRLLTGWPPQLPLPAAAVGAGALGALAYGQEYLYPALAPGHGPDPRSPRLLVAKMAVSGVAAVILAALAVAVDGAVLHAVLGPGRAPGPVPGPGLLGPWAALTLGCAWAGVLAAAVFRTTALGIAAVLAVPVLAVPAVRVTVGGRVGRELLDAGGALWSVVSGVPQGSRGAVSGLLRLMAQPFAVALALSLAALLGAYAASALRGRRRGRRPTPVSEGQTAQTAGKKG